MPVWASRNRGEWVLTSSGVIGPDGPPSSQSRAPFNFVARQAYGMGSVRGKGAGLGPGPGTS